MDNHLKEKLQKIRDSFDAIALDRQRWKRRNWYYHKKVIDYYRFYIPEGYRVLELGSGDGDLLAALKPSRGLGIDASGRFVEAARQRHSHLEFRQGFAETLECDETFDYVVLSELVGHLEDFELVLENLRRVCRPSTRIIINHYNYLWEPILALGSFLHLRMPQKIQNWLSLEDLENLLKISGFDVVKKARKLAMPVYLPGLSNLINRIVSNIPFLRKLCLLEFVIARPEIRHDHPDQKVSILVACRNEKGNIEELVRRIPAFPGGVEVVFVDGRSEDGTRQELERVRELLPEKNVRIFDQLDSKGKGNAVRIAFEKAQGDVFIILDADISVAPEDTMKFYRMLIEGRGEMINGTRLVYPMDKEAMRFLNILGNKFFSLAFTYLLEQRIKDTLCGTKALFRTDYEQIARNRAYFGDFDPFGDFDLLFGAAKLNLKLVEVPVRYYERRYGTTKIHRFRHGLLLLGMCMIAMRRLKFV
ncbi:MAG: glycosyltransferase [Candidatus Omnitrophota bacterium]